MEISNLGCFTRLVNGRGKGRNCFTTSTDIGDRFVSMIKQEYSLLFKDGNRVITRKTIYLDFTVENAYFTHIHS